MIKEENTFFEKFLSGENRPIVEFKETELLYVILSYDEDYLIAYNSSTGSIKYISGNFFTTKVSKDFDVDKNTLFHLLVLSN